MPRLVLAMRSVSKAPITGRHRVRTRSSGRVAARHHLVLELRLHRRERLLAEVDVVAVGADRGVGRRSRSAVTPRRGCPTRWPSAGASSKSTLLARKSRGVDVGDVVGDDALPHRDAVEGGAEHAPTGSERGKDTTASEGNEGGGRSFGGGGAIRARSPRSAGRSPVLRKSGERIGLEALAASAAQASDVEVDGLPRGALGRPASTRVAKSCWRPMRAEQRGHRDPHLVLPVAQGDARGRGRSARDRPWRSGSSHVSGAGPGRVRRAVARPGSPRARAGRARWPSAAGVGRRRHARSAVGRAASRRRRARCRARTVTTWRQNSVTLRSLRHVGLHQLVVEVVVQRGQAGAAVPRVTSRLALSSRTISCACSSGSWAWLGSPRRRASPARWTSRTRRLVQHDEQLARAWRSRRRRQGRCRAG